MSSYLTKNHGICAAAALAVAATLGIMGGCGLTGGADDADSIVFAKALYEDSSTVGSCLIEQNLMVEYPVAKDKSAAAESIRTWLHEMLREHCYPQMEETLSSETAFSGDASDIEAMARFYGEVGMKEMLKAVAPESNDEEGEDVEWMPMGYSNDLDVTLLHQTPRYLTFNSGYSIFTGGAHGLYLIGQYTFRKSDGLRMDWELVDTLSARPILDTLVKEGLTDYFLEIGASSDEDLYESLFLWDNPDTPDVDESKIIPLPHTPPALTEEGVSFVYQQYEIAAYACGLPSFIIPYAKAAEILTPAAKKLLDM